MIPAMTEPTRKSATLSLNGRDVTVMELTDAQMLHLSRHARILQSPTIDKDTKMESMERMGRILDSIVSEADRDYVVGLQETGELTLAQMVEFVKAFGPKKAPAKVTRGRAKRVAS